MQWLPRHSASLVYKNTLCSNASEIATRTTLREELQKCATERNEHHYKTNQREADANDARTKTTLFVSFLNAYRTKIAEFCEARKNQRPSHPNRQISAKNRKKRDPKKNEEKI